jgi:hypothetical protein
MVPVADERDWYQVVAQERCQDCGMRAGEVARGALGRAILDEAARWAELLADGSSTALRRRAVPQTWSALEYGAHVRDVIALFSRRIALVLSEDRPEFGWWDHEEAARNEAYNDQAPITVATGLRAGAVEMAATLASVAESEWGRTGTRRGHELFTVEGLARFCLHEAHHHRRDAERILIR